MTTMLAPSATSADLADRLRHWFAGGKTPSAGVVVLRAGDVLPAHMHPGSVVLHPAGADPVAPDEVRLISYDGSLEYGGGELAVGDDFIVQLEGYATAQYVSVVCPTVVSVLDDVDRETLVADARAAHALGAFPHHLVHPLVVVRDELAWIGAGAGLDEQDTALLAGPDGPVVQRFLAAARVLRALRQRLSGALTVDGFGPAHPAVSATRRDTVFIVRDAQGQLVADGRTGAIARVSADVATAVQATLDGTPLGDSLLARLGGPSGVGAMLSALGLHGGDDD
ncbi:MAG: hypothetical protein HGA44_04525 [Cellulomonadaceae bacterium]|nr:hypothetical protein [Cellulomonadaceae bacterium]